MHADDGWDLKGWEMRDKLSAFHHQAKYDRPLSGASANRRDLRQLNPNVGKFLMLLLSGLSSTSILA
jgi:hypothetical protein